MFVVKSHNQLKKSLPDWFGYRELTLYTKISAVETLETDGTLHKKVLELQGGQHQFTKGPLMTASDLITSKTHLYI